MIAKTSLKFKKNAKQKETTTTKQATTNDYWNYVCISYRFWDIMGYGSFKVVKMVPFESPRKVSTAVFCIVSEIKRDIHRKSRFFHTPFHSTPRLGSRRNIAMPFCVKKLEWCGYPIAKKFEDMFSHVYRWQTDTQTERHHAISGRTEISALCIASRSKNRWGLRLNLLFPRGLIG